MTHSNAAAEAAGDALDGGGPTIAYLVDMISTELGQCAAGLTGLQHMLADERSEGLSPSGIQQLQALDHITQMNAALSILGRHIAHAVAHGRQITADEIEGLPVMEEVKIKALPHRAAPPADTEAGAPIWL